MKTPREILFQRHSSAEPKLDAIRKTVVAEHVIAPQFENDRRSEATTCSLAAKLWMELVLPARRFWLGAAGAWMVILALGFFNHEPAELTARNTPAPAADTLMAVKAQRQFMAQLLEPSLPSAGPAKTERPSPRSERGREMRVG